MFLKLFQIYYCVIYSILVPSTVFGAVYLQEEFSDGDKWQERWILSEHPSQERGFFILSAGKYYGHPEESKGVQTFKNAMKYGLSIKFPPFSNKEKVLVIQYTVKNEQKLWCGGGYIKLFNCSLQPIALYEKTPYLLMFGPDVCMPTYLKMRVIFNYKGKYLEIKKHIIQPIDHFTHLYTLIINPDNTYEIKIDNKDVASGKLRDDWDFLPPEEIFDYKAKRPKDWEDQPLIDDPNDIKPKDWNESDLYVPDFTAKKPDDWIDSIDGEWEPPLMENQDYKGDWKPRRIPNPKYKGPWVRPMIKNPKYTDDPELYKFEEICGIGFDIWQQEAGTIFDNILITDDIDFAEEHGWKTWGDFKDAEKKMAQKLEIKKEDYELNIHREL